MGNTKILLLGWCGYFCPPTFGDFWNWSARWRAPLGTTQGRGRYDRHKQYDKPKKDI